MVWRNRTKLHNAFMDKIDENARSESGPVVSSGISHFREESDNTFRAVFQRADKMMYSRKELLKQRG